MTSIAQFWKSFADAAGTAAPATQPEAWPFGPNRDPDQQTHLASLAAAGLKRATTSVLDDYRDEPLPSPGDHSIVLDGSGNPRCIIRTTAVEIRRFADVDEAFAAAEGEGDGTLDYWRRAHETAFAAQGLHVDRATQLVLEHFETVWPPQAAAGEGI
jgi:uncharacterized protein YhfF